MRHYGGEFQAYLQQVQLEEDMKNAWYAVDRRANVYEASDY